ncbi:MAG: ATP-binding protein [Vicinamibacterales bacterium]
MAANDRIGLSPEQFANAFPFHLAFDAEGRLLQAGRVIARLCPSLTPGACMADLLTIARPREMAFDPARLREKRASLFILRLHEPAVTLRGQMLVDGDTGLFLGSPWLTRMDEAAALGLSLADFANHDPAGEFMLLFHTKDMALADAEALARRLEDQRAQLQDANRRLEANERALQESNEALARAARLKDEFLSNMSHELRTPLNAILGMSESLLEHVYGAIDARQTKAVSTIQASGSHLLELINDILDLSRVEAGRLELDVVVADIHPVCQSALAMVKPTAIKKGITLRLSIDTDVTALPMDQRRMKQILVNLLSNAVKFTPDGGLVTLDVTGDRSDDTVRFSVTDTGIGIADEDLPRLFAPFSQLDSSLARRHGGTGLGLVLTKRMVELHGGRVGVISRFGQGSTFSVTLPWPDLATRPAVAGRPAELPIEDPVAVTEPGPGVAPADGSPQARVLVIDDNESNRTVLADFLAARRFEVVTAGSAMGGIAEARANRPDLILMDMQMPDVDGLEATRLIRRDPELRTVPIFALTGLAMKGDRERVLAAGVDVYVSKPVRLVELITLIRRQLDLVSPEVA